MIHAINVVTVLVLEKRDQKRTHIVVVVLHHIITHIYNQCMFC